MQTSIAKIFLISCPKYIVVIHRTEEEIRVFWSVCMRMYVEEYSDL